jgi:hypothetical protein
MGEGDGEKGEGAGQGMMERKGRRGQGRWSVESRRKGNGDRRVEGGQLGKENRKRRRTCVPLSLPPSIIAAVGTRRHHLPCRRRSSPSSSLSFSFRASAVVGPRVVLAVASGPRSSPPHVVRHPRSSFVVRGPRSSLAVPVRHSRSCHPPSSLVLPFRGSRSVSICLLVGSPLLVRSWSLPLGGCGRLWPGGCIAGAWRGGWGSTNTSCEMTHVRVCHV